MPNDQPGILERITQNNENLAKTSAELLIKEEELSQVKIPKNTKLKGEFSQIPPSTDMLLVGMMYERFTQLDIQTAAKGSSGPLSIQRRLSALEATNLQQNTTVEKLNTTIEQQNKKIEQLNTTIEQQNKKIEQQNITMNQLLASLGDISKTVQLVSKFISSLSTVAECAPLPAIFDSPRFAPSRCTRRST
jgi:uncharacterized coiled-coil protein SlyX